MLRIGVLVSGGGTNLQAILDAQKSGIIQSGKVVCVISSKENAYALKRAQNESIDTVTISRKAYANKADFDGALLDTLKQHEVDIVVLAGFLSILGDDIIDAYPNKIINVHPSLIPSFCGDGFYGIKVHEKVLEYGVKVTGATVHFVNNVTDGGAIIAQKAVCVSENDTPSTLQEKVMKEAEHVLLPQAVEWLCAGRLLVEGKNVRLKSC